MPFGVVIPKWIYCMWLRMCGSLSDMTDWRDLCSCQKRYYIHKHGYNLVMAYIPQFDTMHLSMSLGAIFNDRNFMDALFTIFDLWLKYYSSATAGVR